MATQLVLQVDQLPVLQLGMVPAATVATGGAAPVINGVIPSTNCVATEAANNNLLGANLSLKARRASEVSPGCHANGGHGGGHLGSFVSGHVIRCLLKAHLQQKIAKKRANVGRRGKFEKKIPGAAQDLFKEVCKTLYK
eukprot:1781791-Ditylum_brightwellii.AAC.1